MSADADAGHRIVDANAYLTLATAAADGTPWASPVWFAHDGYRSYLWVSRRSARHSRNIAVRPEVGIVVFDSTVPPGEGEAVYVEAAAREAGDDERAGLLRAYTERSVAHGLRAWRDEDVDDPDGFRLFVAVAVAHYVLDEHDRRVPVDLSTKSA